MKTNEKEIKLRIREIFFDFETEQVQEKIIYVNDENINKITEEKKSNKITINDSGDIKNIMTHTMELPKIKKLISNDKITQNKTRNSVNINFFKEKREKFMIFTEEEWKQMIENNSTQHTSKEKLIFSLKFGINDNIRGKIWMLISNSLKIAMNHNENLFYKLVNTKEESVDDVINKDIERTIIYRLDDSSNKMTILDISKKHEKLFNILKAYAIYDSEVSYCQGTNYIVAILLTKINSERAAFWTFVQIMNDKKWRDIFKHNTPKLMRMLDILRDSIEEKIPDLYKYFEQINFVEYFPAVFTQYFVTLFSYNCPIEYALRVFDLFWIYEEKIIFDCLIHILNLQKEILMKMDMDVLFPFIRDNMVKEAILNYGFDKSLPF